MKWFNIPKAFAVSGFFFALAVGSVISGREPNRADTWIAAAVVVVAVFILGGCAPAGWQAIARLWRRRASG